MLEVCISFSQPRNQIRPFHAAASLACPPAMF
jgi:hypothetical protein